MMQWLLPVVCTLLVLNATNLAVSITNSVAVPGRQGIQVLPVLSVDGRQFDAYFASDRVSGMMKKLGMEHGEAIEHPWVSKAIENAQRKVEGRNFDIRKNLLEFDDVANDQRKVVYEQRNELLESADISATIKMIKADVINRIIDQYIAPHSLDESWDIAGLEQRLRADFAIELPIAQWIKDDDKLYEEKNS